MKMQKTLPAEETELLDSTNQENTPQKSSKKKILVRQSKTYGKEGRRTGGDSREKKKKEQEGGKRCEMPLWPVHISIKIFTYSTRPNKGKEERG